MTGKTAAQCLESNSRCQARITAMVGQLTAMGAAIQSECATVSGKLCLANAAAAAAGTTSAGGGATPPPEWAEMLAVHNERRAQHCAPPLTGPTSLRQQPRLMPAPARSISMGRAERIWRIGSRGSGLTRDRSCQRPATERFFRTSGRRQRVRNFSSPLRLLHAPTSIAPLSAKNLALTRL